jgi:N utilization substance protein B
VGVRREARECALQMMYQWDLRREDPRHLAVAFWEVHSHPDEVREFADRLVAATIEDLETIDALIAKYARHWRMDRMETVDRNVLRIAVEELLHEKETPPAVVIDEAIEVSRRFSTPESPQFINGLLDSIRRDLEGAA